MVVCTRCFQRNEAEGDDLSVGKEPIDWKLLSKNAAKNGYVESHNTTSQQSPRPEQLGHADGSKGSAPHVEAPLIAPLRFSTSFDEPLVDPLSWIGERLTASDLVSSQDQPKFPEGHSGRRSSQDASSVRESTHREDDEFNPSVTMVCPR